MIITCPACEAQYLLPDESIGASGRRVKCTSCAYTWLQSAHAEGDDPHFAIEETPREFGRRGGRASEHVVVNSEGMSWKTVAAGTGVGALLAVLTLGFMVLARPQLTPSWPPLALLYETIGLPVAAPGTGLKLEEVTANVQEGKLQLKGKITNPSKEDASLPDLLIRASGGQGWLKDWPVAMHGKHMPPEQSAGFEYVLSDIPQNMTDVTIRFAE
jgi:predicted Zn finger-like uncharacterized protein